MDFTARLSSALADRYRIERQIGAGGMAIVYFARDLRHDRDVALKLLRPELAANLGPERFLSEIRLTARLQHPHILPLYDSGESDGLLWYAMPYVPGASLRERIDHEGELALDEVLRITDAIAAALDYAHRLGVVHRDIKPENILFLDGVPVLADFGIALAVKAASGPRLTSTGLYIGTPLYSSPEQAVGERIIGPEADVYSLAAVAYEMLTGEPPFAGRTTEALIARLLVESPRPIRTTRPSVPAGVEAAVLKGLSKTPAARFPTALQFARALRADVPLERPLWRRPALTIPVLAFAVGGLAVATIALRARAGDETIGSGTHVQVTFSGNALKSALSPDGSFLAYTLLGDSSEYVVVQDRAGGAADTVLEAGGVWLLDWSPDGTRVLVSGLDTENRAGLLAIVPRAGGQARRLAIARDNRSGMTARWLPDGRRLGVRTHDPRRLLVLDLATEDTTAVVVPGNHDFIDSWAWSPASDRVAVGVGWQDTLRSQLLLIDTAGAVEIAFEDTVPVWWMRWKADGSALYMARGHNQVRRVDFRRGQPEPPIVLYAALPALRPRIEGFQFSMTDSADLFSYTAGNRYSNLAVVTAAGGAAVQTRQLTRGTALRWGAAVSPDGEWIAYAEGPVDDADIYRVSYDGGRRERITHGARVHPESQLAWSPDAQRIAFVDFGDHPLVYDLRRGMLRIASIDGGRISDPPGGPFPAYANVSWAPSDTIATVSRTDDRNLQLIAPDGGVTGGFAPPGAIYFVHWSPGANRVAIHWIDIFEQAAATGIWIVDPADPDAPAIFPLWGWWPHGWSDDGRYIYLDRYAPGSTIYRLDTHAGTDAAPEAFLTTPYRDVDCIPAGRPHPGEFVCTVSDFVSDITLIHDFD